MITNTRYQPNQYYMGHHDQRTLVATLAITAMASTLLIVGYLIYAAYMGYAARHPQMDVSPTQASIEATVPQSNAMHAPKFINRPFTR